MTDDTVEYGDRIFSNNYSSTSVNGVENPKVILIISHGEPHQSSTLDVMLSRNPVEMEKFAMDAEVDAYRDVVFFGKVEELDYTAEMDSYKQYLKLKEKFGD